MPTPRITIRDIATELGLAHSTVSCALRGTGRVSTATRERVRAVAERLGYVQDPALSALNAYRQAKAPRRTEGIAVVHDLDDLTGHRFAEGFHQAVTPAARRLGYAVRAFTLREHGSAAALGAALRARGIRAGLFSFSQSGNWDFALEELGDLATVFLGHTYPGVAHRVGTDDFGAMRSLWRRLRARGYRRIGLVLGSSTDANSGQRWSGAYLSEQVRAERADALERLPVCDDGYPGGIASWLARERPDAVISRQSVRRQLDTAGLRIPADIGYANLGVPRIGVPTAGFVVDPDAVAEAAVALVDQCLRGNDLGVPPTPTAVMIRQEWNEGSSLRPTGEAP